MSVTIPAAIVFPPARSMKRPNSLLSAYVSTQTGDSVVFSCAPSLTCYWDQGVVCDVAFIPTATTTYALSCVDSVSGCVGTDSVTITVGTGPIVDAGIDQNVCSGDSVTLTGSGASSLTWDNGVIDGVPFEATGTTSYVLTGTDSLGCMNMDTVTVTVNNNPEVDLGPDTTICVGESITLDAGSGFASYQWSDAQ